MECTGTAKGAADFFTGNGLAHVVHNDESSMGGVAQTEQCLAESGHGAGVVFILIVSRVEGIEHDDFGSGGAGGKYEVIETLGCTEQMSGGSCIDQQVLVRSRTESPPHDQQATNKL